MQANEDSPMVELNAELRGNVLGLALVRSRLFLDCISEGDHLAVYTCVGHTTNGVAIQSSTKLTVLRQVDSPMAASASKEVERFAANQNSIDMAVATTGKDTAAVSASDYRLESTLTGCVPMKTLGKSFFPLFVFLFV